MKSKKRVKFSKYQVFKHTTESKKKNMVGSNPEVQKRKAFQAALNPEYTSNITESAEVQFEYNYVQEKPVDQEQQSQSNMLSYSFPLSPNKG